MKYYVEMDEQEKDMFVLMKSEKETIDIGRNAEAIYQLIMVTEIDGKDSGALWDEYNAEKIRKKAADDKYHRQLCNFVRKYGTAVYGNVMTDKKGVAVL